MDKKAIAYYNIGILDTIFIYDIEYSINDFVVYRQSSKKDCIKQKLDTINRATLILLLIAASII